MRPIALCNVVYKICLKVHANRLKLVLPSIISPLQSAFVHGHMISDNTLVAEEVAHFMHNLRRKMDGYFSLKLDMSKASDRLEWDFLEAILLKIGFSRSWVMAVLNWLCFVRYSVLINGVPNGYITPTSGIRQGDPLSPYLFILGAEGLSALLTKAIDQGVIRVYKLILMLLKFIIFSLQMIAFCLVRLLQQCQSFKAILNNYEQTSGQRINRQKSSVVFSCSLPNDMTLFLSKTFGVDCVKCIWVSLFLWEDLRQQRLVI